MVAFFYFARIREVDFCLVCVISSCTRKRTMCLMSTRGSGLLIGNCMAPFEVL